MKILKADQIRELDAYTIANEPISSLDLMERASTAFVRCFCDSFVNTRPVVVFCGKGNNGGDGLAIARQLSEKYFDVKVYIVEYSENASSDFRQNFALLQNHVAPGAIFTKAEIPQINPEAVCIDALLGTGLSRPVTGLLAEVITVLNELPNKIVSVDIASGLYTDKANEDNDIIVEPDCTITFQLPKLAFMMPKNAKFTGEWHNVSIGLHEDLLSKLPTPYHFTDQQAANKLIRARGRFSHKGTFGHALLLAGSYGKMGAAVLSSRACLRSGVGLLTVHIPQCGYEIVQISVPESMVSVDQDTKSISELPPLSGYSAIGIGPGIGKEPLTARVLETLLINIKVPLVVDADALNLLSENPAMLRKLPPDTVLTPHPKEFERLAGKSQNEFERLELGKTFASEHQVIICLKGANTAVILPDGEVHFNSTGNPGMATGGTGDVLTGVILSLLAQGYPAREAAILGVYEHGLAGDRAAMKYGQSALIASDVVDCLKW
jgi:ADP-dependent NAD(P)H-hydrate dehydratase / NAD(P)H-hydrate epimerase